MIERYQQRIQPAPNSGLIVDQPAAQGAAISQAGGKLFQASNQYMRGLIRETAEADLANERITVRDEWHKWRNSVSREQDPDAIARSYQDWENKQQHRVQRVKSNRLGRRAIEMDAAKTMQGYRQKALGVGGIVDKTTIQRDGAVWERQMQNALMGKYDDKRYANEEEAYVHGLEKQVTLGTVSQIDAQKMRASFTADRNYHSVYGKLASLSEQYKTGQIASNDEYINRLKALRAEAGQLEMKVNSASYLDSTITLQIGNAAYKDRSQKQTNLLNIMEKSANGTLRQGSAIEYYRQFPEDLQQLAAYAEAGAMTYASSPLTDPTEQKSAKSALDAVDGFVRGDLTPRNAINKIAMSGSKIAPAAMLMLGASLYDASNGADDMAIYERFWAFNTDKKVPIKQDTFLAQTTRRTSEYVALMGGDLPFVEGVFEEALKWQTKNPNATLEERQAKLDEMFEGKAGLALRETTRQVSNPNSDEFFIGQRNWAE